MSCVGRLDGSGAENRFAYTPVEELCQGCYRSRSSDDADSKALPGTNVKLVPTTPYFIGEDERDREEAEKPEGDLESGSRG